MANHGNKKNSKMRTGDKLICLNNINNVFGKPLFIKGEEYTILSIDNEAVTKTICLNHILYSNEYSDFDLEWIRKNFKKK